MKTINGDVAETPIQAIRRQVFEAVASIVTVDDNGATGTGYGSIDEPTPVAPMANPKDPS
ncbi:hypothetical protein IJG04_02195 [Candidatus Saccharibacteria bacterium]|nr:hypothetical protein [Candidatus Saccharibacteria bacterium]